MIFGRKVRLRPSRLKNKGWFAYLVRDLPKAGTDGKTQAPLTLAGTHGHTRRKPTVIWKGCTYDMGRS